MMMINYILKFRGGREGESDEGARLYELRNSGMLREDVERKFIINEKNEILMMRVMKIPSNLKRGEAEVEGDSVLFESNIIERVCIKTLPGIYSFFYSFIPLFIHSLISLFI
jgi:hypothetical protein